MGPNSIKNSIFLFINNFPMTTFIRSNPFNNSCILKMFAD